MAKKEFDYYIFIDYSKNLIGYNIIEKSKINNLLPKISKFRHYRNSRNKRLYLKNAGKTIKRDSIRAYFLRFKIKERHRNVDIYLDVLEFLKEHSSCIIFISVDNHEYPLFRKMAKIVDGGRTIIKKESELIKGTQEYQLSLVLDTVLNIERLNKNDKTD